MKPKPLDTQTRIEIYRATHALLETWLAQPDDVQIKNYDYIKHLKVKERQQKGYLTHRRDPAANI